MLISNERLEELITTEKVIENSPKRHFKVEKCQRRNDFDVYAPAIGEHFHVFMRQNTILSENFSVGLQWQVEKELVTIFRCNGIHGGNRNIPHHLVPHIHKLNLSEAAKEHFTENVAQETSEYTTFDGAIYYFLNHCKIKGAEEYFPFFHQISLFDDQGGAAK